MLQLSYFVAFCKGYIIVRPSIDLWGWMFYLRSQVTNSEMSAYGAAPVYTRASSGFPRIPLAESAKKWQRMFFNVKNVDPAVDCINLPFFHNALPSAKQNWGHELK